MATVLRLYNRLVKEIGEIVDVRICFENNIATTTAISTVRSTFRHEFLAPKTDGPAPAVTCPGKNFDAIDEHFR